MPMNPNPTTTAFFIDKKSFAHYTNVIAVMQSMPSKNNFLLGISGRNRDFTNTSLIE